MEIRVERDPAFWRAVAEHPAVGPSVLLGHSVDVIDGIVTHEGVLPLAGPNGGLVFVSRDGFGRVWELHSLFRPEAWGREVSEVAKAAFLRVFGDDGAAADLVFTHERVGSWRTRPPRSFGFKPLAEPFTGPQGTFRVWGLTAEAWVASPAFERLIERSAA